MTVVCAECAWSVCWRRSFKLLSARSSICYRCERCPWVPGVRVRVRTNDRPFSHHFDSSFNVTSLLLPSTSASCAPPGVHSDPPAPDRPDRNETLSRRSPPRPNTRRCWCFTPALVLHHLGLGPQGALSQTSAGSARPVLTRSHCRLSITVCATAVSALRQREVAYVTAKRCTESVGQMAGWLVALPLSLTARCRRTRVSSHACRISNRRCSSSCRAAASWARAAARAAGERGGCLSSRTVWPTRPDAASKTCVCPPQRQV